MATGERLIEFEDIDVLSDPLGDLGLDLESEAAVIREACDNATFEEAETVRPATDKSIDREARAQKQIDDWLKNPRNGEPIYLDFETVPDFERLHLFELPPLPEMPPVDAPEALMAPDQFVSQTVPEVEAWLAKHNPPREWIEAISKAESSDKKPRKGFFDAVAQHNKRIGEIAVSESNRIKMLSVRPLFCSICCVSMAIGNEPPISIYADGHDAERALIEQVWRVLARYSPLVGYGVSFFDVPVLLTRSMILSAKPGRCIDRRKYGSKDVLDLCRELFNDDQPATIGLKDVCRSLGIDADAGDMNGGRVYDLWRSGKVDEICAYCESDVKLCQTLHRERMAGYFCV